MSENISEMKEEKTVLTPGEILSKARIAKNISVDAVAMELLVSKDRIVELENDNYAKIAAPVYARGYLRSYAHFLQIPEDEVLESFSKMDWYRENKKEDFVLLHPLSEASEVKNKHNATWLIYVFAIIVVVVFFAVFLHKHNAVDTDRPVSNTELVEQKIPVSSNQQDASSVQTNDANPVQINNGDSKNNVDPAAAAQEVQPQQQQAQAPLLQKVESIPQSSQSDQSSQSSQASQSNLDENAKNSDVKVEKTKHSTNAASKKKKAAKAKSDDLDSAVEDDSVDQD
jgi:cytoskeletal protein RodZ